MHCNAFMSKPTSNMKQVTYTMVYSLLILNEGLHIKRQPAQKYHISWTSIEYIYSNSISKSLRCDSRWLPFTLDSFTFKKPTFYLSNCNQQYFYTHPITPLRLPHARQPSHTCSSKYSMNKMLAYINTLGLTVRDNYERYVYFKNVPVIWLSKPIRWSKLCCVILYVFKSVIIHKNYGIYNDCFI